MSPWAIWLLQELIKLGIERLQDAGKFNTLTEEEAKAMFSQIVAALPERVKSPEELEAEGNPPPPASPQG